MSASVEESSNESNTSSAHPHCDAPDSSNETQAFDDGFERGLHRAVDARSSHEPLLWVTGTVVVALLNILAHFATMAFDGTDLKDITSPASMSVVVVAMVLAFLRLKKFLKQADMQVTGSVNIINTSLAGITLFSIMRCVLRSTSPPAVDKWLPSRIGSILSVGLVSFPVLMCVMMLMTFAVQETWSYPSTLVFIIAFAVWLAFLALYHLVVHQGFKEVVRFKGSKEGAQIINLQKEKDAEANLNRQLNRRNLMFEQEKETAEKAKDSLALELIEFKNACKELLKESLLSFPAININDPRVQEALKEVEASGKVEGMLEVIKTVKRNEDRSVPEDVIRSLLRAARGPRVRGCF